MHSNNGDSPINSHVPGAGFTASTISELLRAMQFGDSMLPVGSFSFSCGLESAVQERIVHDRETLREFVLTALEQAATNDGIAVLHAHRAARENDFPGILLADQAVFIRKLNEELRTMSTRMGRKLAEMTIHMHPEARLVSDWLAAIKQGQTPGCYPIGQAIVFASLNLSEQDTFAIHQYGVASTILGAALRLLKVSYLDTQSLLFEVNGTAAAAYERIATAQLDDMYTFAPVVDILAAIHVKSKVRMFMN